MAENVVINGTTYPAVEAVSLADGNGNTTVFYPDAVRYVEQSLTEAQKAQARQNINAMSKDELQDGINTALAQAKESGEFDGAKGEPGIVWRGEYSEAYAYLIGDAVANGRSSYICVENNGGSEPSVIPGEANQTAWQLLASAGKNGNDYVLTDADKNKIVNAVIAALPVYAGEVL